MELKMANDPEFFSQKVNMVAALAPVSNMQHIFCEPQISRPRGTFRTVQAVHLCLSSAPVPTKAAQSRVIVPR